MEQLEDRRWPFASQATKLLSITATSMDFKIHSMITKASITSTIPSSKALWTSYLVMEGPCMRSVLTHSHISFTNITAPSFIWLVLIPEEPNPRDTKSGESYMVRTHFAITNFRVKVCGVNYMGWKSKPDPIGRFSGPILDLPCDGFKGLWYQTCPVLSTGQACWQVIYKWKTNGKAGPAQKRFWTHS